MRKRGVNLQFPLGGLHERLAFQSQPPYTTPKAENVRADASLQDRSRGGSRPGMMPITHLMAGIPGTYYSDPINMLAEVGGARLNWRQWRDDLKSASLSNRWSAVTTSGYNSLPIRHSDGTWGDDDATADGRAAVSTVVTDRSTTSDLRIAALYVPNGDSWGGEIGVHMGLADVSPGVSATAPISVGLHGKIYFFDDGGTPGVASLLAYNDGAVSLSSGVPVAAAIDMEPGPGWVDLTISASSFLQIHFRGRLIAATTIAGVTIADLGTRFAWSCKADGTEYVRVAEIQAGYGSNKNTETIPSRDILVASADGRLYQQRYGTGILEQVSDSNVLDDDADISVAVLNRTMYIVDGREIVSGPDAALWDPNTNLLTDDRQDFAAAGVDARRHVCVIYAQGPSNDDGRDAALASYNIKTVGTTTLELEQSPNEDGVTSVWYRIERGILAYDVDDQELSALTATQPTAGAAWQGIPYGCSLICVYRGRIVVAAGEGQEHMWYMSRQFDPTDWDSGSDLEDQQRPMFGSLAEVGGGNQPITALIPFSDDYLVMGCQRSLWIMRGDPAAGGVIDSISDEVGVVSAQAWCQSPANELYFLSHDGVYRLPPGANVYASPMSDNVVPDRLKNIDPESVRIRMAYDHDADGINLFLTGIDAGRGSYHWFIDTKNGGYWPMTLHEDFDPFSYIQRASNTTFDRGLLLGCRDGFIRRLDPLAWRDGDRRISADNYESVAETSEVWIGPVKMADGNDLDGIMTQLVATLGATSSSVEWELFTGNSAEEAFMSSAVASGTFSSGYNYRAWPQRRGSVFYLRLFRDSGTASITGHWAVETVQAMFRTGGQRRLP
jgi:hypothetical protein